MCVLTLQSCPLFFLSSSHNADCLFFKSGCFLHLDVLGSCVSACWELADLLTWVLLTPAILTALLAFFVLVTPHPDMPIQSPFIPISVFLLQISVFMDGFNKFGFLHPAECLLTPYWQ